MADVFDTTSRIFREPRDLQRLLDALLKRGYCVVGSTVRDGAIVYDPLKRVALYVANEGRFIAIVKASDAERGIQLMRQHPLGLNAQLIGRVKRASTAPVSLKTSVGSSRIVDMLSGEQLPRIC